MKQRVGIIFGGKSAEHQVSLQSARNILEAIDKTKFDVVLLGITKQGQWCSYHVDHFLENPTDPKHIGLAQAEGTLQLQPGQRQAISSSSAIDLSQIDIIFPIVHGTLGEDGTLQGLLRILNLPFVGSDVLGSAISMDKDVTKRLLRDAGLTIAPFITLTPSNVEKTHLDEVVSQLGLPLFVKPANQGSSVGVSKVETLAQLGPAIQEAFRFDRKVLVETAIKGREVECAVLGNEQPKASRCGEIVLSDQFYSYETKYINEQGAQVKVPADIDEATENKIRDIALKAYQAVECFGLARVDVFLTPSNEVIINEINTLPGFTNISMYPKLWQASGLSYQDLITTLLELAVERHQQQNKIMSAFDH
ncbi:D-alanine-D-alanine ligase [Rosenbergiella nectarea]|uniref:D-alanine--D-alanine ligase n=1 Tax=Rosenbergiella nectarea TaxID=988801 RepID=A0A1H9DQU9_9GAMM|nr:D-alanine--D-alanine ligase [Rosenbergiella nectarea]SEQ15906.1 D-alanine-D-alanine ligase [Rosenbergiella nectarea]